MGSMAENSILVDEKQDKENSPPPHPITPVSKRPSQPPVMMRSRPFGTRIENVPDYVYRILFEKGIFLLLCQYFNKNYNLRVSFHQKRLQKLVRHVLKKDLVTLSLVLLIALVFCIHQNQIEKKMGHHSKINSQGLCENEYKTYCLNGGERYYQVEEGIVRCNCTWLNGGKRREKYMWWDYVRREDQKR